MVKINIDELRILAKDSLTINELYKRTGIGRMRLRRICEINAINLDHFTPGIGKSTRSQKFEEHKICCLCSKKFTVSSKRDYIKQKTCSYECSNKYFRSGENSGNWKSYDEKSRKNDFYRRICFNKHGKKCIICDEKIAIDVHHIDDNHRNNDISNLIPLCANHHRYTRIAETKNYINEQINLYIKNNPLV